MYSSFYNMSRNPRFMYPRRNNFGFGRRNQDRIFGGFAVPFLLGGITGAALSNNTPFYGPYPTNFYYNNFYPYYYPYYY